MQELCRAGTQVYTGREGFGRGGDWMGIQSCTKGLCRSHSKLRLGRLHRANLPRHGNMAPTGRGIWMQDAPGRIPFLGEPAPSPGKGWRRSSLDILKGGRTGHSITFSIGIFQMISSSVFHFVWLEFASVEFVFFIFLYKPKSISQLF